MEGYEGLAYDSGAPYDGGDGSSWSWNMYGYSGSVEPSSNYPGLGQFEMWPNAGPQQGEVYFNPPPDEKTPDIQDESAGDEKCDPKGRGRGRNRGKGGKKGNGKGSPNGENGGQAPFMFYNRAFVGEWIDSLGHSINVKQGRERRGPLFALLTRGDKEQNLSLRRADSGMWTCGNAFLDEYSSGPSCLVWASPDGKRSVWRRWDTGDSDSPPDLLPWLLHSSPVDQGEAVEQARTDVMLDGARVSAILDARQVLGADRASQDILSYLLMDHDMLRREDEDMMIPAHDSSLWERLPEVPRRNVLYRLSGFNASTCSGCPVELANRETNEVHVGRHCFAVASTDVQALRKRWSGPDDVAIRNQSMVHVVALYRALETPLNADDQRSSMQLGWDPVDRKRAGINHELFASPFNASVDNGKYGSRWPHIEKFFGSAGSYPSVIDVFPENAIVGVNPPFSDAYLDHVMNNTLDRLVSRFKKVHLFVPVCEAPWRPQLRRLEGSSFVRQFWDSTALRTTNMAHPVLYWQGNKLADL